MNHDHVFRCGTGRHGTRRDLHDGCGRLRRIPASLPFDRTVT